MGHNASSLTLVRLGYCTVTERRIYELLFKLVSCVNDDISGPNNNPGSCLSFRHPELPSGIRDETSIMSTRKLDILDASVHQMLGPSGGPDYFPRENLCWQKSHRGMFFSVAYGTRDTFYFLTEQAFRHSELAQTLATFKKLQQTMRPKAIGASTRSSLWESKHWKQRKGYR